MLMVLKVAVICVLVKIKAMLLVAVICVLVNVLLVLCVAVICVLVNVWWCCVLLSFTFLVIDKIDWFLACLFVP